MGFGLLNFGYDNPGQIKMKSQLLIKFSCTFFRGRSKGEAGHGAREIHVGADAEHGGVLGYLAAILFNVQTRFDHGLQAVDEKLRVLGAAGALEGAGEAPQAAEATWLQVVQLLLAGVLAGDHVLDDGLHGAQDLLVVAKRQHFLDVGVQ